MTSLASGGWFDADAHVIEPPELWAQGAPAALADRVIRLESRPDGDWLVGDGRDLTPIGRLGGLARGDRSLRLDAAALAGRWDDAIVPGAYDPEARLAAMERDGVAQALLFPTIGMMTYAVADPGLRAHLRGAYNRWIASFCAAAPERLCAVAMVDPDDDTTADEIRLAAERGMAGVLVPLWADEAWPYAGEAFEPLWALAASLGLAVGFHAFASRRPQPIRRGVALAVDAVADRPATVARAFASLLFSGIFERNPELRWFSAENDAGWCPYFLERAEQLFARAGAASGIERTPTEQWQAHVAVTFTHEQVPLENLDRIGASNLMWGSDYPHNITTWPESGALTGARLDAAGLDAATRRAVTYDNAARFFRR